MYSCARYYLVTNPWKVCDRPIWHVDRIWEDTSTQIVPRPTYFPKTSTWHVGPSGFDEGPTCSRSVACSEESHAWWRFCSAPACLRELMRHRTNAMESLLRKLQKAQSPRTQIYEAVTLFSAGVPTGTGAQSILLSIWPFSNSRKQPLPVQPA